MRWLLTTPADADLEEVRKELEAAGGALESDPPVPLGDSEQALYAVGPEDLHKRLEKTSTVVRVSPDSEQGYSGGQSF